MIEVVPPPILEEVTLEDIVALARSFEIRPRRSGSAYRRKHPFTVFKLTGH